MTTDGTYWHEVGHAFGLDDEYGGETQDGIDKKNGCDNVNYRSFSPGTYQMCDAGTAEKRTIYHYLAVSRSSPNRASAIAMAIVAPADTVTKGPSPLARTNVWR
jgi:hypothetical protein